MVRHARAETLSDWRDRRRSCASSLRPGGPDGNRRERAALERRAECCGVQSCLGHLVANLPGRLTVDGRIHAETYISAVGAIAGYAAQRTLFAASPPVMGVNIHRAGAASGEQYWFGDSLNYMLVPKTEAEANRCVWSLAVGGAAGAGIGAHQMPRLDAMFEHVASTIGQAHEGRSSVVAKHQAHLPARDLLKAVWPVAVMCFSGNFRAPAASIQRLPSPGGRPLRRRPQAGLFKT